MKLKVTYTDENGKEENLIFKGRYAYDNYGLIRTMLETLNLRYKLYRKSIFFLPWKRMYTINDLVDLSDIKGEE